MQANIIIIIMETIVCGYADDDASRALEVELCLSERGAGERPQHTGQRANETRASGQRNE
jgi:hypothetical protein